MTKRTVFRRLTDGIFQRIFIEYIWHVSFLLKKIEPYSRAPGCCCCSHTENTILSFLEEKHFSKPLLTWEHIPTNFSQNVVKCPYSLIFFSISLAFFSSKKHHYLRGWGKEHFASKSIWVFWRRVPVFYILNPLFYILYFAFHTLFCICISKVNSRNILKIYWR